MMKFLILIFVVIFNIAICYSQPEIVENGQPSDTAKPGTLTASGEGSITINAYVSQINMKLKGDIIIPSRSKDKIKFADDKLKPESLTEEDIEKYLPSLSLTAAGKAAAKKAGYVIYRGIDGEAKLNDNRFIVKIFGKVEAITLYGIGVVYFDGIGKYKVTKEGSAEVIEMDWQKINPEENTKKKSKTVLLPVIYGDYKIPEKAKPKPKEKPKDNPKDNPKDEENPPMI